MTPGWFIATGWLIVVSGAIFYGLAADVRRWWNDWRRQRAAQQYVRTHADLLREDLDEFAEISRQWAEIRGLPEVKR